MRYDTIQLTDVLSSLKTRSSNYLFSFPVFYNERSYLDLYKMAQAKNEDELLETVCGTIYYDVLKNALPIYLISENLMVIQTAFASFLDKEFIKLTEGKKKSDLSDKSEVGKLYKTLNDVTLVTSIYRMQRFTSVSDRARTAAHQRLTLLTDKQFSNIINVSDADYLCDIISDTYQSDVIPENGDTFSHTADKYLYRVFSTAVKRSTDADTMLFAYIWLAENEIKNIIHIIEGIRYGMTPVEILPMLCGISHEQ